MTQAEVLELLTGMADAIEREARHNAGGSWDRSAVKVAVGIRGFVRKQQACAKCGWTSHEPFGSPEYDESRRRHDEFYCEVTRD